MNEKYLKLRRWRSRVKEEREEEEKRHLMPPLGTRRGEEGGYSLSGSGGFTCVTYHFDDYDNLVGLEIYEEAEEVTMDLDRDIKVEDLPKKVYDQLIGFGRILPFPLLLDILPTGGYVDRMKTSWWEGIRNSMEYKDAVNSIVKLSELIDKYVEKTW